MRITTLRVLNGTAAGSSVLPFHSVSLASLFVILFDVFIDLKYSKVNVYWTKTMQKQFI